VVVGAVAAGAAVLLITPVGVSIVLGAVAAEAALAAAETAIVTVTAALPEICLTNLAACVATATAVTQSGLQWATGSETPGVPPVPSEFTLENLWNAIDTFTPSNFEKAFGPYPADTEDGPGILPDESDPNSGYTGPDTFDDASDVG
jgi:hypothetical protein